MFFLLLAITVGCKQKEEYIPFCQEFPEQCVSMEHIKDHFFFNVGSYWIYREVTTDEIDSQWVSSAYVNSVGCGFECTVESSISEYHHNTWSHLNTSAESCGLIKTDQFYAWVARNKTMAGDYEGEQKLVGYSYKEGDSLYNYSPYHENNMSRLTKIHPTYQQLNKSYNNVLEITIEHDPTELYQPTKLFYAEHVGLIRREFIDSNQVWLLISHEVQQ
jgi:hypothetical protein